MNIKNKLSILLLSCLLAACTSENEMLNPNGPDEGQSDDATRREVLLSFKNKLNLVPAKTKADDPIATAEENYIRSLDIYVFGSKEEDKNFTFQELFYYRDDAATIPGDGDWAHSFNLTATDKDNITTALLRLQKGLFVKLYCVVNRTELFITEGHGGATTVKFTNFQPLKQSSPGQPGNTVTPGIPTEEDFQKLHSQLIDPAIEKPTEDDALQTPLPMAGSYTTPVDLTDFSVAARTQLSFKLTRMVARFDIVNDASLSKFTITSISMGNGQDGSSFFPIKTLGNDLITYPDRPLDKATQTTAASLTKGAFYSWPSPTADHGYLILKGEYAVNKTETQEVTYQVPFQQTVNGENVGSYIEVAPNHRYTIAITKADTYHLDFTLNVADWDDQEHIDEYNPDKNNDFDKDTPVTLITDADASKGAYVLTDGSISLMPAADSKIAFEMGSNSVLEEKLIYKTGSAQWLVVDEDARTKAASMTTKYTYKTVESALNSGDPLLPVTIQLINPASGKRKEIVVVATQGPVISFVSQEDNYNTYDAKTKTATLYNIKDQTIQFHAVAEDRGETTAISFSNTGVTWLSADATPKTAVESDFTLTLGAAQSANTEGTVKFISDLTRTETSIKVILKDAAITALKADDFNNMGNTKNTFDPTGNTGKPKVSLEAVADNQFKLNVVSPEGVTTSVTGGTTWLSQRSSVSTLADGSKQTVIIGSITGDAPTTAQTDGEITIVNKIDNSQIVIKVITEAAP